MCFRILLRAKIYKIYFLILLNIFCFSVSFSQNNEEINPILDSFKAYTKNPREVAYAHLNKSIYLIGETLAFTVYVFDKGGKTPSPLTTNLYCSISDYNGKTIKSKMLLVTNGIGHGSFNVDSLFTSGNYIFKAYTNWMKNFEEQNFYLQNIKVVDPEIEIGNITKVISSKLDTQFLPEGGHLVANVENNIGVVIKDSLGFGVAFVEGEILNSKNEVINSFKTNQFGIGKFTFTPEYNEVYKALINYEGLQQTHKINIAEANGIALSLFDLRNKVVIKLSTNDKTLESIKNKVYKLTIHNGSEFKITSDVVFNNKNEILKYVNYNDLSPGINVFTLFNEKNVPLLERLYFKYDGLGKIETDTVFFSKKEDSTLISIPVKNIDPNVFNNFSISILPQGTKSYNHNHNIFSYIYLQPYVNGLIENAQYYFTDINRKKKYDLDNLLLTQGWSSYNWNTVFNNPPNINYKFETGINLKANVNNTKTGKFILYPTPFNGFEVFEMDSNTKTFEKNDFFPLDSVKLKISELRENNYVKKSEIYVQFTPNKIPDLGKIGKIFPLKENIYYNFNGNNQLLKPAWEEEEYERLDEVVIKVSKEKERIENLKSSNWGNVDVFDNTKRNRFIDLAAYLNTQGFRVTQSFGTVQIRNLSPRSFYQDPSPTVYIDDRLLFNFDELYYYRMDYVDYIIIDKSGHGEGIRGAGGVIKIYTDSLISNSNYTRSYQEIEVPLTFTSPTKFYKPKYITYESNFFNDYGVIEWFPNKSVDENGTISFKISNQSGPDIKLFIEGTTNNGDLISEVITLNLN